MKDFLGRGIIFNGDGLKERETQADQDCSGWTTKLPG